MEKLLELLLKKDYASLIKKCAMSKEVNDKMVEVVKLIDGSFVEEIKTGYLKFMNEENNVFTEKELEEFGDEAEVRITLAELAKAMLGSLLVQRLAELS